MQVRILLGVHQMDWQDQLSADKWTTLRLLRPSGDTVTVVARYAKIDNPPRYFVKPGAIPFWKMFEEFRENSSHLEHRLIMGAWTDSFGTCWEEAVGL